jgi:hypothetical protein
MFRSREAGNHRPRRLAISCRAARDSFSSNCYLAPGYLRVHEGMTSFATAAISFCPIMKEIYTETTTG